MSFSYEYGPASRLAVLLLGALVGGLVVGLIWVVQAWRGSDAAESARTVAATEGSAPLKPGAGRAATTWLGRCREVYDAQGAVLETGADALDQWEVHIGAMNKLVTGAITLEQAQQFWDQTRVGAAQNLAKFAKAERRYHRRTARCPAPARSEEVSHELRSCVDAVVARRRTLHLSSVALATWRMHVHHMEMLRSGEMSAEEATRLWLESWHRGVRQVTAYHAAARDADGTTC
jgi:hypothetical protein